MWDEPTDGEDSGEGAEEDGRLLRLVYVSVAAQMIDGSEFARLEAVARRRNGADGLTGLLVAQGPFFYGILEGPHTRLLDRMEEIIADRRHRGLRILHEEHPAARRFCGWSLFRLPDAPSRLPEQASIGFIFELARRLERA
jgi:hypothetical protein